VDSLETGRICEIQPGHLTSDFTAGQI